MGLFCKKPKTQKNMADTQPTTQVQNDTAAVEQPAEQKPASNSAPVNQSNTLIAPPCKSLHVTDLAPSVTESTLLDHFSKIGPNAIASIRVCRDAAGNSLGYAYVNFNRAEDCERALDVLNFEQIAGQPCRISKVNRDPSIRKSGVGNLFVKNLSKDIDHAGLYDVFSTFGEILSVKVATEKTSTGEIQSKGYGFVHFASKEDAENAINSLNGKCLNDKQVFVTHFIPRPLRPQAGREKKDLFTNIYLKHLRKDITQNEFENLVSELTADLGKITSAKLMTYVSDGKEVSKGFGFTNFENNEVAQKALDRFQDTSYVKEKTPDLLDENQSLYASVAKTKEERRALHPQNTNLYVKNIVETVTQEQFQELFEFGPGGKSDNPERKFGKITSACIMTDEKGAPKGFGFACYETKEAATKALNAMNGYTLEGKPLYVAIAQQKEERKRQLAQQFNTPRIPGHMPMSFVGVPPYYVPRGYPPPPNVPRTPVPQQFRGGRAPQVINAFPGRAPQNMQPARNFNLGPHAALLYDFVKGFPEEDVNSRLGEILYKTFLDEVKEEYLAKNIVGNILSKTQGKSMQQAVEIVLQYISDPVAKRSIIQSVQQSLPHNRQ